MVEPGQIERCFDTTDEFLEYVSFISREYEIGFECFMTFDCKWHIRHSELE